MCFQSSAVRPYQKWNWAGNEIIQDTALPVERVIYRKGKAIRKYTIDIREFLSIEKNAVIKKLIKNLIEKLPEECRKEFYSNDFGSRDFRVKCCQEYLKHFTYSASTGKYDSWQYPEETIVLKSGDCEDFAFLLASLIEACDISSYCLRVALGRVVDHSSKGKSSWDHAWVVYQDEFGAWQIIEPVQYVKYEVSRGEAVGISEKLKDVEYVPHFVFNRDHLWRVRSNDSVIRKGFTHYLSQRNYFNKFHPAFAASVHSDIFDEALKGLSWWNLQRIKAVSLYVDVNTAAYDPRDHFDFAYINESWDVVKDRLATGKIADFALAAHAIADFYAHSTYGLFMLKPGLNTMPPYNIENPKPDSSACVYDFDKLGKLPGCDCIPKIAADYWTKKGQIISGQWYRWFASIPNELQNKPDFQKRRCLPDHDAIAVDHSRYDSDKHLLFKKSEYIVQYEARRKAAIEHISNIYKDGKYKW